MISFSRHVLQRIASELTNLDVWVQMWTDALSKGDNKKGHRFWLGIYGLLEVLPLISLVGWIW